MIDARKVFKTINIIPDWVNGHFVQWQLDPFFVGERPYNFSLEATETTDFSVSIPIKLNLGEVFHAIDDSFIKQSWAPNYSYRVTLTTADGHTYNSFPVLFGSTRHEQRKFAMAAEIIRKEILLSRYVGTQAWILRRKSYGTQSKKTLANIDPISGVPLTDTKNEDYGVGLDQGYYAPVPCVFYIEQSTQDKQLDKQGMGVKENYTSMIRMPGYPILEVRDIICEATDGYRYSIQSRSSKQFPGTNITLTQKATINLIPPSDTTYAIPIPIPL
jgi:hypothetical protein